MAVALRVLVGETDMGKRGRSSLLEALVRENWKFVRGTFEGTNWTY